jgi:hypothetical protein
LLTDTFIEDHLWKFVTDLLRPVRYRHTGAV